MLWSETLCCVWGWEQPCLLRDRCDSLASPHLTPIYFPHEIDRVRFTLTSRLFSTQLQASHIQMGQFWWPVQHSFMVSLGLHVRRSPLWLLPSSPGAPLPIPPLPACLKLGLRLHGRDTSYSLNFCVHSSCLEMAYLLDLLGRPLLLLIPSKIHTDQEMTLSSSTLFYANPHYFVSAYITALLEPLLS